MTEVYPSDTHEPATEPGRHAAAPVGLQPEDITRVVVRPLASPLPLSFLALGIASFLIAMQQVGIIPPDETRSLYLLLAIFAFPAQLLSAVLCFLTREPLVATGIGLISLVWPTTAVVTYVTPMAQGTPKSLGLLDISVAVALLLISAPAVTVKPLLSIVICTAAARFILTGVYALTASNNCEDASAILGFAVLGMCAYGAVALGLEDVRHKTVLPTGRFGEAREAFNGDLAYQLKTVATEAGVRRQL